MQGEQACREDQKLKIINQQSHENHFLIEHGRGVVYIQMCVGGGEERLESIKLLTSFIQQMHKMKPRNVWPKSPHLKMFIFIFTALDVCCSF